MRLSTAHLGNFIICCPSRTSYKVPNSYLARSWCSTMRHYAVLLCSLLLVGTASAAEAPLLAALPARIIGPANMGGRICDVEVVESDPRIVYVGAANGGLWKTRDGGATWESLFDEQSTLSIG